MARLAKLLRIGLLVLAVVLALYALLAGSGRQGAWLAAGLAIGVAVATSGMLVKRISTPFIDLGVAIRPLVLPLLLVVAAGTVDSPLTLQIVVGFATMLVAFRLFIWPEKDDLLAAVGHLDGIWPTRRRPVIGHMALYVAALTFGIVWFGATRDDRPENAGGFTGELFEWSVVLLLAAVALRLLGYARTRARIPTALLLGAAVIRLGMEIGVLPWHAQLQRVSWLETTDLLVYAAVAVAFTIVAEWGAAPTHGHEHEDQDHAARWFKVAGLVSATLSMALLLFAMVLAANPRSASGALSDAIDAAAPDRPRGEIAAMSDHELAAAFSPVLLFSERARWAPTTVTEYLDDAIVIDWRGEPVWERMSALPGCPGTAPKPCYKLTTGCTDGESACARGAHYEPGTRLEDGSVYTRVVRRYRRQPDDSPNPFRFVEGFGTDISTIVQYWYFYDYDDWISPVLGGFLRQSHEADWEAITIGFSARSPLFVGFSQHCGGQWYRWDDIRVADGPAPRLRPLVAVADGSQANYRYPNPDQAPDWTGCANLPARTTTLVSYASNIRDRTGVDWSWSASQHIPVHAARWPMSFAGRWAPYSRTQFDSLHRKLPLGADAPGPASPPLQPLWRDPLRTIFLSSRWHRGGT